MGVCQDVSTSFFAALQGRKDSSDHLFEGRGIRKEEEEGIETEV